MLPDFHGNRSPLADPHALGVISGLTLDASFDSLCRLYWRTAVGIALGVRHILDTLNDGGFVIDTLHVTGGHTKNPLLMELYADAVGCTVVEPLADEAVLTGTAWWRRPPPGSIPISPAPAPACSQRGARAAAEPGGAGALRPRLPHLPRNAPAAAGAGRDGVAAVDNAHRMMNDAGIAFDLDRLPKLVMALDGVPDDVEELTLLRQEKSHRGL